MTEVVWRTRAARHLTDIYRFIYLRNPSAAERYASDLRQACLSLNEFPEKASQYNQYYRGMVFRNHIVFYRYDRAADRVHIVAILDGRRDVKAILRGIREPEA